MNVDPIDFNGVDRHHRPGHGLPADFVVEPVALQLGAGLGVGEAVDAAVGIQDDGAGHHRPGQAAAADFVHAGHRHEAVTVEGILDVLARGNLTHECDERTLCTWCTGCTSCTLCTLCTSCTYLIRLLDFFHARRLAFQIAQE